MEHLFCARSWALSAVTERTNMSLTSQIGDGIWLKPQFQGLQPVPFFSFVFFASQIPGLTSCRSHPQTCIYPCLLDCTVSAEIHLPLLCRGHSNSIWFAEDPEWGWRRSLHKQPGERASQRLMGRGGGQHPVIFSALWLFLGITFSPHCDLTFATKAAPLLLFHSKLSLLGQMLPILIKFLIVNLSYESLLDNFRRVKFRGIR